MDDRTVLLVGEGQAELGPIKPAWHMTQYKLVVGARTEPQSCHSHVVEYHALLFEHGVLYYLRLSVISRWLIRRPICARPHLTIQATLHPFTIPVLGMNWIPRNVTLCVLCALLRLELDHTS